MAPYFAAKVAAADGPVPAGPAPRSRVLGLVGVDLPAAFPLGELAGARRLQAELEARMDRPAGLAEGRWSARRSLALAVGGSAVLWSGIAAATLFLRG